MDPESFRRAYERVTPAMKRNAGPRDKFERTMETLSFLNEKVAPDSGTAGRIIANVAGGGEGKSHRNEPPSPISAATRTAYRRATVAGARRWD